MRLLVLLRRPLLLLLAAAFKAAPPAAAAAAALQPRVLQHLASRGTLALLKPQHGQQEVREIPSLQQIGAAGVEAVGTNGQAGR